MTLDKKRSIVKYPVPLPDIAFGVDVSDIWYHAYALGYAVFTGMVFSLRVVVSGLTASQIADIMTGIGPKPILNNFKKR